MEPDTLASLLKNCEGYDEFLDRVMHHPKLSNRFIVAQAMAKHKFKDRVLEYTPEFPRESFNIEERPEVANWCRDYLDAEVGK